MKLPEVPRNHNNERRCCLRVYAYAYAAAAADDDDDDDDDDETQVAARITVSVLGGGLMTGDLTSFGDGAYTTVFVPNMITPTAAALQLIVEGQALMVVRIGFAVAGAAIAWIEIRTPRPLGRRLTALVASDLFLSPKCRQ